MKPIEVRPLTKEELTQLDELYHRTKDVGVRSRAQMILLGAEEMMIVPRIAKIVLRNDQTVRRWIKHFNAEGCSGLSHEPKSGPPRRVTDSYRERLLVVVHQRPRSLEQPYSL